MSEEKKKEISGKTVTEELHKASIDEMIVRAKPAGYEPPTPQPKKQSNEQSSTDQ